MRTKAMAILLGRSLLGGGASCFWASTGFRLRRCRLGAGELGAGAVSVPLDEGFSLSLAVGIRLLCCLGSAEALPPPSPPPSSVACTCFSWGWG